MGSVLSVHISGQGSKNKAITASLGKKICCETACVPCLFWCLDMKLQSFRKN